MCSSIRINNLFGRNMDLDYSFNECKNLASVSLGNNIKKIGSNAFYNCYNLTTINFPNSIEHIGS